MKTRQSPRRIAALLGCSMFLLWACSGAACGYTVSTTAGGAEIRWQAASAGFFINSAGAPPAGSAAIQAAMQTWTAVPTSSFSFFYRGQTASTAYGQNDGANIICFGSLGDSYTLALNTSWYNPQTGRLLDSDIKFNTYFDWATNASPDAIDVQTIALHELGHSLALDDLYGAADAAKAMYGFGSPGEIKRSLAQDDKNGITHLYGSGGSTTTTAGGSTTTSIPVSYGQCPAEYALGHGHPDLELLRALRDGFLARSPAGRRIIEIYYDHAGSINEALERSPALRAAACKLCKTAALLMARNH